MDEPAKRFKARYDRAKTRRDLFAEVIDSCYEYALPLRQRMWMMQNQPVRTDRLFDGTAVNALQALASETLDGVWPLDQTPFELKAGLEIPEQQRDAVNRQLAPIASMLIEGTNNSNFLSAAHEMLLDWGIGTGFMTQNAGTWQEPLDFQAIPLTEAVADIGPFGRIDFLARCRKVRVGHLSVIWPRVQLTPELEMKVRDKPEEEIEIIEGEERDWSRRDVETWVFRVVWKDELLVEDVNEGIGSCSFVAPSFMRVSGETMGRGPMMMALPDTRTANALRELLLEHADMMLSGIWQYDDNGSFNPDTATMEPGALIPRVPGTKGLEGLTPPGDIRVGDIETDRVQGAIREALFVNDLGSLEKTPRSATEVMQRTADRARRLSGPYGRLLTEWLFPQVSRTWWLLKRQEGMTGLPPIDGKKFRVRPLSPITRAQAQDDVLRHLRFLEIIQQFLGPQAPLLLVDQEKFAPWAANATGFNPTLLNSSVKIKQIVQQVAQLSAQQGAAQVGGAPPA